MADEYLDFESGAVPVGVPVGDIPPEIATVTDVTEDEIERYRQLATNDLIAEMEAMTPEKRQAVYDALFGADDTGLYESQMKYGEELSETGAPGMRKMGRLYQAANPLEFISPGVDRYKGRQMYDKATADYEGIMEQREIADTLRGKNRLGLRR